MPQRKTEFWWASIHGADPEPVEKIEHDGRPCVFTLGCADPFYLDEEPCPVLFVDRSNVWEPPEPMVRPRHPDKIAADKAAKEAAQKARRKTYIDTEGRRVSFAAPGHGWRGPR